LFNDFLSSTSPALVFWLYNFSVSNILFLIKFFSFESSDKIYLPINIFVSVSLSKLSWISKAFLEFFFTVDTNSGYSKSNLFCNKLFTPLLLIEFNLVSDIALNLWLKLFTELSSSKSFLSSSCIKFTSSCISKKILLASSFWLISFCFIA